MKVHSTRTAHCLAAFGRSKSRSSISSLTTQAALTKFFARGTRRDDCLGGPTCMDCTSAILCEYDQLLSAPNTLVIVDACRGPRFVSLTQVSAGTAPLARLVHGCIGRARSAKDWSVFILGHRRSAPRRPGESARAMAQAAESTEVSWLLQYRADLRKRWRRSIVSTNRAGHPVPGNGHAAAGTICISVSGRSFGFRDWPGRGGIWLILAGFEPTPPRWMGRVGLEWLYRLAPVPAVGISAI